MLKSYLTTALRALRRRMGYAFLNISGLALGLAACLLIGLYVQDELSYDAFHDGADRTYRVLREFDLPDLQTTIAHTPSALGPALEEGVAAAERVVRTVPWQSFVVARGETQAVESDILSADDGFFELFSFPLVRGTARLGQPRTAVLTERLARKYFAGEDAVGQTLRFGEHDMEVTGVVADPPSNTHLDFGAVVSLATFGGEEQWGRNDRMTYLRLREGVSQETATQSVTEVVDAHTEADDEAEAADQNEEAGDGFIPHLQPLTGIHLGQGVPVEIASAGSPLYVWLFGALAVFIVLLACINFMNLATARAAERRGEVGMRKALGAGRGQLAAQFLGEAVLMALLALVCALVLARLALPLLNALGGKTLAFSTLWAGPQALLVVGLALVVGLVAGSYPALVLSGFAPARALKGTRSTSGGGGQRLRQGLVVFQFAISIALLIGTAVVFQQLRFMKSAGLGFEQANLLLVEQANFLEGRYETFADELARQPGVERVATGFSVPGTFFINSMWRPATPGAPRQNLNYSWVGHGYPEALGLELVAGRSFQRERAADSMAVILNESAAREYGWAPEEAVGKRLMRGFEGAEDEWTVVGVAKDFHYEPLHETIYPAALFVRKAPWQQRYVVARLDPGATVRAVEAAQQTWAQFSDLPFQYSFVADNLAAQYRAEDRLARVFGTFAALAVLIACLGLFGLAAYTAQQRTKEIGVRKALGASVASVVALLSKDFLKLVAAAFVVAAPLAYVGMRWWLMDFAYRITPGVWTLLAAGVLAVLIAAATISYQSVKAACANPIDALRYE